MTGINWRRVSLSLNPLLLWRGVCACHARPNTPPRPAAVLIHGHPSRRTPPILPRRMRRDGNSSEAMALWGGRGGDALEQRRKRAETETPTPQIEADSLPRGSLFVLLGLVTLVVPFYPSGSDNQHLRKHQYMRGAIVHVRRRTCVLSIEINANARN